MSHMIERLEDGTYAHCYAGETPWHTLGKKVRADLTPAQMQTEASLDWTVEKVPAYYEVNGVKRLMNRCALVRSTDGKKLDEVTTDWKPVQNHEAFEFFNEYVMEGSMSMHTAGSLRGGQIVWALAKIKEGSFAIGKGSKRYETDPYLLFTNPHKYGSPLDVRFTAIEVVCNNTLTAALSEKGADDRIVRISHDRDFIAEEVKVTLNIAMQKMKKFEEAAKFISKKKYNPETVMDYFKELFPSGSGDEEKKVEGSRLAKICNDIVETQPGYDAAPGTWWNAFNAVTFVTDHVKGNSDDNRLNSIWYGGDRRKKIVALERAVELADAS